MAYQTINPATGERVKAYVYISDQDLEVVIGNAHKAFKTGWRHYPIAERARIVSAATAILRKKNEEVVAVFIDKMLSRVKIESDYP